MTEYVGEADGRCAREQTAGETDVISWENTAGEIDKGAWEKSFCLARMNSGFVPHALIR